MTSNFFKKAIAAGLCFMLPAGCEVAATNPVIFGQETLVGISIGQSATSQTPEFSIGYEDSNVAYLPTVAHGPNGEVHILGGVVSNDDEKAAETYSVLGQFDVEAKNSSEGQTAGLGKFFATGNAAVKLAAGFACGVSDGKDSAHCHKTGN